MVGQTVSHYRVLEKVAGGMGAVYEFEDIELKWALALKFLAEAVLNAARVGGM
jgi:hypothetical protein